MNRHRETVWIKSSVSLDEDRGNRSSGVLCKGRNGFQLRVQVFIVLFSLLSGIKTSTIDQELKSVDYIISQLV